MSIRPSTKRTNTQCASVSTQPLSHARTREMESREPLRQFCRWLNFVCWFVTCNQIYFYTRNYIQMWRVGVRCWECMELDRSKVSRKRSKKKRKSRCCKKKLLTIHPITLFWKNLRRRWRLFMRNRYQRFCVYYCSWHLHAITFWC